MRCLQYHSHALRPASTPGNPLPALRPPVGFPPVSPVRTGFMGGASVCTAVLCLALTQAAMPMLVLPALHVRQGDSTDMFSVQIQQAARLAHVGKLDSEGQSMVRRTLGIEAHELASRYVWYNVDPAKASLLSDDFDAKAFLLWSARMTVKHPVDTLSSWLGVEQGWLSLRTGSDANMAVSGYAGEDNSLQPLFASASRTDAKAHGEIEDDMTPGAHAVSGWYSFLAKAPVIGLLFGKALWSSMLPGYMLFAACRAEKGRRLRALAMIAPVTLSFLFQFSSVRCPSVPKAPATRFPWW